MSNLDELWREVRILQLQFAGLLGAFHPDKDDHSKEAEAWRRTIRLLSNRQWLEDCEKIDAEHHGQ